MGNVKGESRDDIRDCKSYIADKEIGYSCESSEGQTEKTAEYRPKDQTFNPAEAVCQQSKDIPYIDIGDPPDSEAICDALKQDENSNNRYCHFLQTQCE